MVSGRVLISNVVIIGKYAIVVLVVILIHGTLLSHFLFSNIRAEPVFHTRGHFQPSHLPMDVQFIRTILDWTHWTENVKLNGTQIIGSRCTHWNHVSLPPLVRPNIKHMNMRFIAFKYQYSYVRLRISKPHRD